MFSAIEFIVFVDDSLLESQLFHNGREAEYPAALEARIKQLTDNGWTETPSMRGLLASSGLATGCGVNWAVVAMTDQLNVEAV